MVNEVAVRKKGARRTVVDSEQYLTLKHTKRKLLLYYIVSRSMSIMLLVNYAH